MGRPSTMWPLPLRLHPPLRVSRSCVAMSASRYPGLPCRNPFSDTGDALGAKAIPNFGTRRIDPTQRPDSETRRSDPTRRPDGGCDIRPSLCLQAFPPPLIFRDEAVFSEKRVDVRRVFAAEVVACLGDRHVGIHQAQLLKFGKTKLQAAIRDQGFPRDARNGGPLAGFAQTMDPTKDV